MIGFGYPGHGSGIRRGGVGVVSGRRVFGTSTTSQVHASRADSTASSSTSYGDTGNRFGSTSNPWELKDQESRRKKRVPKYKVYAAEGKVKASLKRGIRWIKNKCVVFVHGC